MTGHQARYIPLLRSSYPADYTACNDPPRPLSPYHSTHRERTHSDSAMENRRPIHVIHRHNGTTLILIHDETETFRLAGDFISGEVDVRYLAPSVHPAGLE